MKQSNSFLLCFPYSLAQLANVLGVGLSFILGTFLVRESVGTADSTCSNTTAPGDFNAGSVLRAKMSSSVEDMEAVRGDIERLLYLQAGLSAGLLLLVVLYYPR